MREINKRIKDLKMEVTRNTAAWNPGRKLSKVAISSIKKPIEKKELLWSIDEQNHVTEFLGAVDISDMVYNSAKIVMGYDSSNGEDLAVISFGMAYDSIENCKTCISFFYNACSEYAEEILDILKVVHHYDPALDGYVLSKKTMFSIYTKDIEYSESAENLFHSMKVLISEYELLENTYGDCYEVTKLSSDIAKYENTLLLKNDMDTCRILLAFDIRPEKERVKACAVGARVEVVGRDGYNYLINKSNHHKDSRGEKCKLNPFVVGHEAKIVHNIFRRFGINEGPADTKELLKSLSVNVRSEVELYSNNLKGESLDPTIDERNVENSTKIIQAFFGALILMINEFNIEY